MPHPTSSEITVTPIKNENEFGAIVTGVDLNDLSDDGLAILRDAIYRHKVIVVKAQHDLAPVKQFDFVRRLDPTAPAVHGHGTPAQFKKNGGLLSKRPVPALPGAENVRILGAGLHPGDHFGIQDLKLDQTVHTGFHAYPLQPEDVEQGQTRFIRWHIDAPLYEPHPPRVTTLRCIRKPKGPDMTVRWDDESGLTMQVEPGRTCYFSGSQLYNLLSPEEQCMVDNSRVEYAPHPYVWAGQCKANSNGLGLVNQSKELSLDQLPEWETSKVLTYPMVWVNPVTGEKALQVHGLCARRLFVKDTPEAEERMIEKVEDIRAFLHKLQYRILRPEYIFAVPSEEGDVAMWDNMGVMHSAVEYPEKYGPRLMHQAHIGSSTPPVGPAEVRATA